MLRKRTKNHQRHPKSASKHAKPSTNFLTFDDFPTFLKNLDACVLLEHTSESDIPTTIPASLAIRLCSTRDHTVAWIDALFQYIQSLPPHHIAPYIYNICHQTITEHALPVITLINIARLYPHLLPDAPPEIFTAYAAGDADTYEIDIPIHLNILRHIFAVLPQTHCIENLIHQTHTLLYKHRHNQHIYPEAIVQFTQSVALLHPLAPFGNLKDIAANIIFTDLPYISHLLHTFILPSQQLTSLFLSSLPPKIDNVLSIFSHS